ncbi:hypothetical protein MJH12_12050, partial [bacterium]|nr:hypothetical protein [bacterium]
FGSCHQQETSAILSIISKLKHYQCHFIVAPRHLNYLKQYEKEAQNLQLSYSLKSQEINPNLDFTFLDTYGELSSIYKLSEITVICGSFENIGGHSILEPAIFNNAILYGPHMQNNIEICQTFERANASLRCNDYDDLQNKIELLLTNDLLRTELSNNAYDTVSKLGGATSKIFAHCL